MVLGMYVSFWGDKVEKGVILTPAVEVGHLFLPGKAMDLCEWVTAYRGNSHP